MVKYSLSVFLIFLYTIALNAQGSNAIHKCAYDIAITNQEKANPGYREYTNASFDFIKNQIDYTKSGQELTIKVVVHIVFANQDENLGEERILRVIESINNNFNGDNSIPRGLRSEFHSVVGQSNINFVLENIEYVQTNSTFTVDFLTGLLPDNVKSSTTGGSDAWDTDEYLNIWVCNIEFEFGTLLGYAYPPSCAPNWPDGSRAPSPEVDGVVIHYPAFDTEGVIVEMGEELQIRGRVVTHEIGHYLGLRHVWGDGQSAIIGIPDCIADDGISDTPNQGLPSGVPCDPLKNTCTDTNNDLPDMFENYMDYTEEECQNTFTQEQVDVMRSTIFNCRINILSGSNEQKTQSTNEWEIYPNPNTLSKLYLKFGYPTISQTNLTIINFVGMELFQERIPFNSLSYNINTSSLVPGVYFVRITTISGETSVKKLLVK